MGIWGALITALAGAGEGATLASTVGKTAAKLITTKATAELAKEGRKPQTKTKKGVQQGAQSRQTGGALDQLGGSGKAGGMFDRLLGGSGSIEVAPPGTPGIEPVGYGGAGGADSMRRGTPLRLQDVAPGKEGPSWQRSPIWGGQQPTVSTTQRGAVAPATKPAPIAPTPTAKFDPVAHRGALEADMPRSKERLGKSWVGKAGGTARDLLMSHPNVQQAKGLIDVLRDPTNLGKLKDVAGGAVGGKDEDTRERLTASAPTDVTSDYRGYGKNPVGSRFYHHDPRETPSQPRHVRAQQTPEEKAAEVARARAGQGGTLPDEAKAALERYQNLSARRVRAGGMDPEAIEAHYADRAGMTPQQWDATVEPDPHGGEVGRRRAEYQDAAARRAANKEAGWGWPSRYDARNFTPEQHGEVKTSAFLAGLGKFAQGPEHWPGIWGARRDAATSTAGELLQRKHDREYFEAMDDAIADPSTTDMRRLELIGRKRNLQTATEDPLKAPQQMWVGAAESILGSAPTEADNQYEYRVAVSPDGTVTPITDGNGEPVRRLTRYAQGGKPTPSQIERGTKGAAQRQYFRDSIGLTGPAGEEARANYAEMLGDLLRGDIAIDRIQNHDLYLALTQPDPVLANEKGREAALADLARFQYEFASGLGVSLDRDLIPWLEELKRRAGGSGSAAALPATEDPEKIDADGWLKDRGY